MDNEEPTETEPAIITGEWNELDVGEAVEMLCLPPDGALFGELVGLLMTVPETRPFLRIDPVDPAEVEGNLGYLLAGSRIFINRAKFRDLRGDIYAASAVWVLSHSWTWAAGVALFRKTVDVMRVLDGQDRIIVGTLARLGAQSILQPVADSTLESEIGGDVSTLRKRFASLAERGIMTRDSGGWRLTP